MQRLEHPRVHVVAADQHGQLDDLAFGKMVAKGLKNLVRNVDVLGHGVGEGQRGALLFAEMIGAPPGFQRGARLRAQGLGFGQGAHMLAERVFGAVQVADADDDNLAQAAIQFGLPSDCVVEIEPGAAERRALQQEFVDINKRAAPGAANIRGQLGEGGIAIGIDQFNAGNDGLF